MHFETQNQPPHPGGLKITIVEKRADGTCRISVYTTPVGGPKPVPHEPAAPPGTPREESLVALAS